MVFDDWFQTVGSDDNVPDFNTPEWMSMFGDSSFQYPLDTTLDSTGIDTEEPSQVLSSSPLDQYSTQDSPYLPDPRRLEREIATQTLPTKPSVQPSNPPSLSYQRESLPTAKHESVAQREPKHESVVQRELPSLPESVPHVASTPPAATSRMVRNLDDFNKKGIKESNSTLPRSARTRRKPELLSPTTLGSNFFELHPKCGFAAEPIGLDSSDWNDDLTRYQFNSITSTSPSTTRLTHASPHFRQFGTQAEGKTTGYYQVPATELGYEANTCPKLMLLRVECDTTTLFGSAKSKRDPDTLSWDEAMSEDPESVKNWLA